VPFGVLRRGPVKGAMPESKNRRWLVEKAPDGPVGPQNFRWTESAIPSPGEGLMLVRNLWLSFDPTQVLGLGVTGGSPIGGPMGSFAVSQVIESHIPKFQRGDLVYGASFWEDYSVVDGKGYWDTAKILPGASPRLAAGTLGITGMVAYFGVVEIGRPRSGETVLVSSAAGGVGSIAVQVAKLLGARVIGIAGGKEKCEWLVSEAHVDAAIDHRREDVAARLDALCPEGIDVYFDNVGGATLDLALERMRPHGRVVLCGTTARYRSEAPVPGPKNYWQLIMVNGRMEGLLGKDYFDRFPEAMTALKGWVDAGKIRSKEDVVEGLEHAPETLERLYSGANVGKQLLKIADPVPLAPT
jgi:NADPH-dependent curcumin reductase